MTVDGGDYYHNIVTDEVSWEKPVELQTAEERQTDTSDCIWLEEKSEGGWVPAYVLKRGSNSLKARPVDSKGGKDVDVPLKGGKLYPLTMSHIDKRFLPDDLVLLQSLDPPLVAYCLRHRFQENKIYTWVGADHTVLVSLNPFKRLPIYGPSQIAEFSAPSPNRLQAPHTFAIANAAYRAMTGAKADISILISGESGAGKTEATKQCLNFLADVAGSASGVEQRILQANPILEAFGNAKTLRNDNSSRFGRWMEVHFHARGLHENSISGAFVENYLLEKSRVVSAGKGERSYHIFYQLCASPWAASLSLGDANGYAYLASSGCVSVPSIDDTGDFDEVVTALSAMGFAQEDTQWLFFLCAAILHLGNVKFSPTDGGEGSAVAQAAQSHVGLAAHYLQVDQAALGAALVERQTVVRGEVQRMRNNVKAADEAVEALAKAVYSAMFDELVKRINAAVGGERGVAIGVLDIFGFEIFEKNSFEQLCINFTNERLQQKFNSHTFTQEESLYVAEGAPFDKVPFLDNTPVLELLSAKKPQLGVLILLDEEVRTPQGSDAKWLAKISERHGANPVFGSGSGAGCNGFSFLIRHYAGTRWDAPRTQGAAPHTRAQPHSSHPSASSLRVPPRRRAVRHARLRREERRQALTQPVRAARRRGRGADARALPAQVRRRGRQEGVDGRREVPRPADEADDHRRADAPLLHPVHQTEPAEAPRGDGGLAADEDDHRAAHVRRRVRGRQDPEDGVPVPPRAPRVRRHLPMDRAQGERLGADTGAPAGGAGAVRRRRVGVGPPGLLESAHRPHALPVPRRRPSN